MILEEVSWKGCGCGTLELGAAACLQVVGTYLLIDDYAAAVTTIIVVAVGPLPVYQWTDNDDLNTFFLVATWRLRFRCAPPKALPWYNHTKLQPDVQPRCTPFFKPCFIL